MLPTAPCKPIDANRRLLGTNKKTDTKEMANEADGPRKKTTPAYTLNKLLQERLATVNTTDKTETTRRIEHKTTIGKNNENTREQNPSTRKIMNNEDPINSPPPKKTMASIIIIPETTKDTMIDLQKDLSLSDTDDEEDNSNLSYNTTSTPAIPSKNAEEDMIKLDLSTISTFTEYCPEKDLRIVKEYRPSGNIMRTPRYTPTPIADQIEQPTTTKSNEEIRRHHDKSGKRKKSRSPERRSHKNPREDDRRRQDNHTAHREYELKRSALWSLVYTVNILDQEVADTMKKEIRRKGYMPYRRCDKN